MAPRIKSRLDSNKRYLQIALNNNLTEARKVIFDLPPSDRIIIEAGTPLIKQFGINVISQIRHWAMAKSIGTPITAKAPKQSNFTPASNFVLNWLIKQQTKKLSAPQLHTEPYIVADLKTMDRGRTEVAMAAQAGASAAVALGLAPIETIDEFISACQEYGIDPMLDMMNVDFPLNILGQLKQLPPIIILHRGVDEERFNNEKLLPYHEITRIKGRYDVLIAMAGGDTSREIQSSIFNGTDIVVIWKQVFTETEETSKLVNNFLKQIK